MRIIQVSRTRKSNVQNITENQMCVFAKHQNSHALINVRPLTFMLNLSVRHASVHLKLTFIWRLKEPEYWMTLMTLIILFQFLQWSVVCMKRDLLVCFALSCACLTSDPVNIASWAPPANMTACTFILVSQFSYTDITVPRWRSSLINAIGDESGGHLCMFALCVSQRCISGSSLNLPMKHCSSSETRPSTHSLLQTHTNMFSSRGYSSSINTDLTTQINDRLQSPWLPFRSLKEVNAFMQQGCQKWP